MAMTLSRCARYLADAGVRHHVDAEECSIRVVFVTRSYKNLRDERLAILRITVPDEGCRCRVALERAFALGDDVAADCVTLARLAADTPLVGFEFDADFDDLRIVSEAAVEDGELTSLQLLAMVDRTIEAAEVWQEALHRARSARAKPGRANKARANEASPSPGSRRVA